MQARTQQLSRTALGLAAVFASFPIAGRLILGEWTFDGAAGLAGLLLAAGVYLHIRARRLRTAPDPAAMLEEAIESMRAGRTDRALRLLNRTIAENPRFWQALQHRGHAHLARGNAAAALADFDEAIRLAPDEPHLLEWRSRAEERLRESGGQG
jgi:tetratricopeptide (TPR) repeat protein